MVKFRNCQLPKGSCEECPQTITVKNAIGDLCDKSSSRAMELKSETSNVRVSEEETVGIDYF